MRLKQLELQGYKSFAYRIQFLFDGGITAVVGPNGSGKSNVADAIRWVLGEQSYRILRGKRSEDMIFAGSAHRARLGMASVSLLLDNADGWLPVEFAEVRITRRAYRSGENEYLLNGQRVRLRDISELLAKSGLGQRTYTVIGQGLVDAVLSLRPEDRRALFEEAAGIALYRERRAEALVRMDETRSNLLRVNDIIDEITPRLHRLEREAERAERYNLLQGQLDEMLRTWYGFRWQQAHLEVRRSRDSQARRAGRLTRQREALVQLDASLAAARERQALWREQLGNWHRESSELHLRMEELQRELAVWQERARLLTLQADELEAELLELDLQAQSLQDRISAAESEVAASAALLRDKEELAALVQSELDALEAERTGLSRAVAETQARLLDIATRSAERGSRLDQIEKRLADLALAKAGHAQQIGALSARQDELGAELRALDRGRAELEARHRATAEEQERLRAGLAEAASAQDRLRAVVAEALRGVERLRDRHELLGRLRQEGEGLHAGVRAVLQAAQPGPAHSSPLRQGGGRLRGILGTVAQLLQVPAEYETAVEVALAGHLQDLVVEAWADAEGAIAYLQAGRRGRATFLPLDTVRPPGRLEVDGAPGVIGCGADLVQAEPRLGPVLELLLGRTVVVRDLPTARRVFERLRGGFQIVTLAGEVLRSGGSVTGGQAASESRGQTLAREREWRELPQTLSTAQERLRRDQWALQEGGAKAAEIRQSLQAIEQAHAEGERALSALQGRRRDLAGALDAATQQMAWQQGLVDRLEAEAEELVTLRTALGGEVTRLATEKEEAERQAALLQERLALLRAEALYRRLAEARSAASVARGSWEHRQAACAALRESREALQRQLEAKGQRLAALRSEQDTLAEQVAAHSAQEALVRGSLASLAQQIEPAEAEVALLESQRAQMLVEESALRTLLREAENRHGQALLSASRAEERLRRLRRQIVDDFGLVEMGPVDGVAEQLPLPLMELVSALPAVESLPERLEDDIHQVRAQMKRMGAVNPTALEEYAEVRQRHAFLTGQVADLEEAAQRLRRVIGELDEVMRTQFDKTFEQVSLHFRENFTRLFGGGTARLILSEPDESSPAQSLSQKQGGGVEIVASLPGKRPQSLALLSGGERALTAVALIFALLNASPPPFCVLDEVDAMLDEANVGRFRQMLEELAQQIQFIVITHNRTTMDAAGAVYGVSMGEDSVSQVVSLRLDL